jgi:hypothetical protein
MRIPFSKHATATGNHPQIATLSMVFPKVGCVTVRFTRRPRPCRTLAGGRAMESSRQILRRTAPLGAALVAVLLAFPALAHGVADKDAAFIEAHPGLQIVPFLYLGAKHMVTGYDHLLFLAGVIFFLYRLRDVALYVTMFSLGHSITLLSGVLLRVHVDPFLVDAVIGLSVVWKALDNLGAFPAVFGVQPDNRVVVLAFGLVHGFGLATKLQDLELSAEGLVPNILAFNLGVELGQILALGLILLAMVWWRSTRGFARYAVVANVLLMTAGFVLAEHQLAGYVLEKAA